MVRAACYSNEKHQRLCQSGDSRQKFGAKNVQHTDVYAFVYVVRLAGVLTRTRIYASCCCSRFQQYSVFDDRGEGGGRGGREGAYFLHSGLN